MDENSNQEPKKIGIFAGEGSYVHVGNFQNESHSSDSASSKNTSSTSLNDCWNLPFSKTSSFVGRTKELKQLHELLQKSKYVAITNAKYVMGEDGIGKSELAREYLRQNLEYYQGHKCWLDMKEKDNLVAQILNFAINFVPKSMHKEITTTEKVRCYWSLLSDSVDKNKGIVIVDNVEENDFEELHRYIPKLNTNFKVLITTRDRKFLIFWKVFSVDLLSSEEALELLRSLVSQKWFEKNLDHAQWLCYDQKVRSPKKLHDFVKLLEIEREDDYLEKGKISPIVGSIPKERIEQSLNEGLSIEQ